MPLDQKVAPDAVLAKLVGSEPISRPKISTALWDYIKQHNAQDATNRRQINAVTPELRAFFNGADSATMFELPRYIGAHVTKLAKA